jgi:hypothetical protein
VLLTGAEELARQRLLELQNQNPTNDAIKGMLAALQDQAGRTSGPAALLTRGKAQRAVKDYLLEAMLGYGIQNTGAIRFGEYSRQTGLEDRTVEERASASTQVLRRLSEVPSQINAEIIRLQDKATQTGAYQSFMEQNFVDEGERPAKLTQGFEAFRAALAKGDIRSDDVVNLDRQGGILVQALQELKSGPVFDNLDAQNKERLHGLMEMGNDPLEGGVQLRSHHPVLQGCGGRRPEGG